MERINFFSTNKAFKITVAALLAVVLIFGSVLGVISAVRSIRSVVSYGTARLDRGVVNYLASTYKNEYIAYLIRPIEKGGLGIDFAFDGKDFWESESTVFEGLTWGEAMSNSVSEKIKRVAVGAHLFGTGAKLTREDREAIKAACAEVLEYKAGGDKNKFNELAEPYGFDYRDFVNATELIYKAMTAEYALYGTSGEALADASFHFEREDFLKESYSHVKILFISTSTGYRKGEGGEIIPYTLSDSERAEVFEKIAEVRRLIAAVGTDAKSQMSSVAFTNLMKEHPINSQFIETGYYLSASSRYSAGFEALCPGLVKTALEMKIGEYRETSWEDGACFIYKYPTEESAYAISNTSDFFDDFFTLLSSHLYTEMLGELITEVKVKDAFLNIDYTEIECNWDFLAVVG